MRVQELRSGYAPGGLLQWRRNLPSHIRVTWSAGFRTDECNRASLHRALWDLLVLSPGSQDRWPFLRIAS